MAKNYYEILGVPENASDADIEAAFKVKAREVHPDTVPADNAYLRKVASEAFKDLSEAKATLLDPTARQKFDASLAAERERNRESGSSSTSSASATENTDSSSPHRVRTGSRTGSSRRPQSVPSRARTGFPEIRNLNSFLFMVLGMATIFFLAVLVASGRMPPLWLAIITAAIGILLFVNGMRPVRGFTSGRPALIGSAVTVTCISVDAVARFAFVLRDGHDVAHRARRRIARAPRHAISVFAPSARGWFSRRSHWREREPKRMPADSHLVQLERRAELSLACRRQSISISTQSPAAEKLAASSQDANSIAPAQAHPIGSACVPKSAAATKPFTNFPPH